MRRFALVLLMFSAILGFAQPNPVFVDGDIVTPSGGLVTGDFNMDGIPDLAILNDGQDVAQGLYVYFGTGHGNVSLATTNLSVPGNTQIASADMNGDGWLDVVVLTRTGALRIWLGDGHGHFAAGPIVSTQYPVYDLQLGDLNGDGRIDIVSAGCANDPATGCSVEAHTQTVSGTFPVSQSFTLTDHLVYGSMHVADINRDGKTDLILAEKSAHPLTPSDKVMIWKGLGTGKFQSATALPIPSCDGSGVCYQNLEDIAVAGFFNDGNLHLAATQVYCTDAFGTNCKHSIRFYKNDGTGHFTQQSLYHFDGGNGVFLLAADFNGDQNQDLTARSANVQSNTTFTLLGNGQGGFKVGPHIGGGFRIITRDMQLSSRQDLIASSELYGESEIGLNVTPITNCPPPPSNKLSAKICSAKAGATPGTIAVHGSGNSPAGVQRVEIWVDGTKRAQAWSDQIAKPISLTPGFHTLSLIAVDKYKGTSSTTITVSLP